VLPRKYRLGKNKNFSRVFKDGSFTKGKIISLKKFNNNLLFARVGFVVGQKVAKKSVDRVKVKRRLSSIIERLVGEINDGVDVIILPTSDVVSQKYEEIEKELRDLLKKAKIL